MRTGRLILAATGMILAASFVVSCIWFWDVAGNARFEPAATGIGVIGGVMGILADRVVAGHELRRRTLHSLADELAANRALLLHPSFLPVGSADPRPQVFPRLRLSCVDAALASPLSGAIDDALSAQLHVWRDLVHDFNRRLDLTELRAFLVGNPWELRDLDDALHRAGGYLDDLERHITELETHLPKSRSAGARSGEADTIMASFPGLAS